MNRPRRMPARVHGYPVRLRAELTKLRTPAFCCRRDLSGGPMAATLDRGMLNIDGSAGEGGGQILRTALALSLVTGRPFRIDRIRAARRKPGLLRQHLTAVQAAVAVSGAQASGAELGSQSLTFEPSQVR